MSESLERNYLWVCMCVSASADMPVCVYMCVRCQVPDEKTYLGGVFASSISWCELNMSYYFPQELGMKINGFYRAGINGLYLVCDHTNTHTHTHQGLGKKSSVLKVGKSVCFHLKVNKHIVCVKWPQLNQTTIFL